MARKTVILAATILVALGMLPTVGPASARPLDALCGGTITATFSPGLRFTPQDVAGTFDIIFARCTSASTPSLKSGTVHVTQPLSRRSCHEIITPGHAAHTIKWTNGQTSRFVFNRTITTEAGSSIITLSGIITEGLFAGDSVVQTIVYPTPNPLDCLAASGVTRGFGPILMLITSRPV